ncbi:MAG: radical SAM protein [Chloroflexi bacterium]|nr:radical SAM protein [Chloroflexota bacterium]
MPLTKAMANTSLLRVLRVVADNPLAHAAFLALARRTMKPRRLRFVAIEPINDCNLRCSMCPFDRMTRKKQAMSIELFTKIVDEASAAGVRVTELSGFGEPLLDKRLAERIRYAKSKGMYVFFFTNGTLWTHDKALEILEAGLDRVIFSFDSATAATYEKIRVGADFEQTRANIIGLVRERNQRQLKKPVISINVTLQKHNLKEVAALERQWKGIADNIHFQYVSLTNLTPDNDVALPPKLRIEPTRSYPCGNILGMSVRSDGRVTSCGFDYNSEVILGDLTEQTVEEVWNSEAIAKRNRLHLAGRAYEIERCRRCSFSHMTVFYRFNDILERLGFFHFPTSVVFHNLRGGRAR